ncbi:MAG: hypothetical protein ACRELF_22090 [Gemmataceae bacterium]
MVQPESLTVRLLQTIDGLVAASAIVFIDDEEYPADDKSVAYRKIHYRYTSTETRTAWAQPDDVDTFLMEVQT